MPKGSPVAATAGARGSAKRRGETDKVCRDQRRKDGLVRETLDDGGGREVSRNEADGAPKPDAGIIDAVRPRSGQDDGVRERRQPQRQ